MRAKVAITLDADLLRQLDRLVSEKRFPNRRRAIQEAVEETLNRLARTRLARECDKLDSQAEREMAQEGLAAFLKGLS